MPYLLDLLYGLLLLAASPWLIYAAIRQGKYRAGFAAKFWGRVPLPPVGKDCLWLHAVSVGEVNVLVTLIPALRQRWPQYHLVVTTTTRTGFELACRRFPQCTVSYAPLDFSWAVRTALRRLKPKALILVELEVWPNLIRLAKSSGVRIAIVNGRLSESSAQGYQRIGRWIRPVLAQLDVIAVQNDAYAQRFLSLGARIDALTTTGSVKFDGAQSDRENAATSHLSQLAGLNPQDRVLLAGSTQQPEESIVVNAYRRLLSRHPGLRLIVVPRHPQRFAEVAKLLQATEFRWLQRSQLESVSSANAPKASEPWQILLVDTIGELSAWWGVAEMAFVGGSLGNRGGQNMIEPAAYGAAVCFGPNTKNFRDVTELLLRSHAAVVVENGQELTAFVERCLTDAEFSHRLGRNAQQLVETQRGATARTMDCLNRLLAGPQASTRVDTSHAATKQQLLSRDGVSRQAK